MFLFFRMTTCNRLSSADGLFNQRTDLNQNPRTRNMCTAQITLTVATGNFRKEFPECLLH